MTKETKMAGGGADTTELMAVFAAYTEANDARLAEIEAKGDSDPLTDERLARIDRRLEGGMKRVEDRRHARASSFPAAREP